MEMEVEVELEVEVGVVAAAGAGAGAGAWARGEGGAPGRRQAATIPRRSCRMTRQSTAPPRLLPRCLSTRQARHTSVQGRRRHPQQPPPKMRTRVPG